MGTGSRRGGVLVAGIMLLAAGFVAAQAWRGQADLEVRVSSRKGGDLAGARVELKYREGRDGLGPPAVATDSQGRAILNGLAAGTWQVEVTHPEFMSFVAVVQLDAKEKPQITASFLEASAESVAPIQVKLLKSRGGTASPPLPVVAAAPPAREEPAATPTPRPEPSAVQPMAAPVPPALPVQPSAPPAAEPAPMEPAPEAETRLPEPAAQPAPAPAPEIEHAPTPDAMPTVEPAGTEPEVPSTPRGVTEPSPEPTEPDVPSTPRGVAEPSPEPTAEFVAEPAAEEPAEQVAEVAAEPTTEPTAESLPAPAVAPKAAAAAAASQPAPGVPAPIVKQPEPQPSPEPTPQPALPEPSIEVPVVEIPEVAAKAPEPMAEPTAEVMPEVAAALTPESEAAAPMAQVEPEPMPMPGVVAPAPAPPPPASPQTTAAEITWNSYRLRNCPECRPGEWSVTVEANLTGDGSCGAASLGAADSVAKGLGERTELAGFAGDLDRAVALLPAEASAEIAGQLATARLDGCRLLGVTLPEGSRFVGFAYAHEGSSGRQKCVPDQPCPGAGATFIGAPRITGGAAATVVHSLAHGKDGIALMTVFFRAPNDRWAPQP